MTVILQISACERFYYGARILSIGGKKKFYNDLKLILYYYSSNIRKENDSKPDWIDEDDIYDDVSYSLK